MGNIVKIIRPLPAEDNAMGDDFAYQPLVKPLYNAIFPRLSAHDIDQVENQDKYLVFFAGRKITKGMK